jgi:hypothetical protein
MGIDIDARLLESALARRDGTIRAEWLLALTNLVGAAVLAVRHRDDVLEDAAMRCDKIALAGTMVASPALSLEASHAASGARMCAAAIRELKEVKDE